MIYYTLQKISSALLTMVNSIWIVEESALRLMMSSTLMVIRMICHPLMLIPSLSVLYYVTHKFWLRRRTTTSLGMYGVWRSPCSPRGAVFNRGRRSFSSRSYDSVDLDIRDDDRIKRI